MRIVALTFIKRSAQGSPELKLMCIVALTFIKRSAQGSPELKLMCIVALTFIKRSAQGSPELKLMCIVALTFIKRSATYMLLWFYKLKSEDDVVNEISILWCRKYGTSNLQRYN
ncbi:hypothetical protein ES23_04660 [Staphylococcus haemolyticus]|nr:hypothetical protein ES24_04430 [Staphylococcus haemolyticus]KGJ29050.1 hypothetical protein ES23_04660 [Staphylococcus haemolyticus]